MTYEVKTTVFEGPLDLLLQLITKHELAITDLSLSELVSEYLAHLDAIRELDIEVTSEFLLIAATLIQLKARYLLPDDRDIDLDEELALMEERDRLLSRLLACLTFKDVAAVLAHRMAATERFVPRLAGLDPDIVPRPPEVHLEVTPAEFAAIAARAFAADDAEPDLDHLDFDLPSVDHAIADVRRRMTIEMETDFERLVDGLRRNVEVVAYFLAVLELARWGIVSIDQEHVLAPIVIRQNPDAPPLDLDVESDWSNRS